jgi:EpsI family protein
VSFLIVLAQETRSRTHAPEQCLSGEGYTIIGACDREVTVGSQAVPIREIQLSRSQGPRLSWHFYKSGDYLTTSYYAHQIGVILHKLKDPSAADALIRAEADADPNNPDRGQRVLADFFGAVTPYVLNKLP